MNSGTELSRHIRTAYPFPIAFTHNRLIQCVNEQNSPAKAILLLRDCYESTVRYLALVSVALYVNLPEPLRNIDTDRIVLEMLALPSTGTWVNLLVKLAQTFQDCGHQLGDALYASLFDVTTRKHKERDTLITLRKLVTIRNNVIGHGATRADQEYQEIVERELQNLKAVFQSFSFLSEWTLFYPYRSDFGQCWMGASEPRTPVNLSSVSISNQHFGHYVLYNDTDYFSLHPYVIDLKCPDCNAHRLCFYDSQHKAYDKRKEVTLLEYVGGHRFVSAELAPELERHFDPQLIQDAYRSMHARLLKIEEHILDQGHLLRAHRDIVGRDFLRLKAKEFIASHDRGVFLITGQPGIGKTAFLADYARRHHHPAFFYQRDSVADTSDQCVRSLYYQLLKKFGRADRTIAASAQEYRTKYFNLLQEIDTKVVIVIDALDEARESNGFSALDVIPRDLPPGVFFVVASRETARLRELHTRPYTKSYHIEPLSEPNLRDAAEFVRRRLEDLEMTQERAQAIARAVEGNFLILGWICDSIQAGGITLAELDDPSQLGLGEAHLDVMRVFYDAAWIRVEHAVGNDLTAHKVLLDVAGILTVANAPLTAEQIASVLQSRTFETEFALHRLRQFLEVVSADDRAGDVNYYRLFHSTFRGYLVQKFKSDLTFYHKALADYFSTAGAKDTYALDGLAHHLFTLTELSWESFAPYRALFDMITRARAEACFEQDGHYGRFLDDLDYAIRAARELDVKGLPKLIELCLIKSGFHTVARAVPREALIVLAQCGQLERALIYVNSIGDVLERACTLARLAAYAPDDQGSDLAWEALREAKEWTANQWQSSVSYLTKIGAILAPHFPEIGKTAFEDSFQILHKYWDPDVEDCPLQVLLENWQEAVIKASSSLIPYAERIRLLVAEKGKVDSDLLGRLAVPLARLGHEDGITYFEMARELVSGEPDSGLRRERRLVQKLLDAGRQDLAQEWYPGVPGSVDELEKVEGLVESARAKVIEPSIKAQEAFLDVDISQEYRNAVKRAQRLVEFGNTAAALRLIEPLLALVPRETNPFGLQRSFLTAATTMREDAAVVELVESFPWETRFLHYVAKLDTLSALTRTNPSAALDVLQFFFEMRGLDSLDEDAQSTLGKMYNSALYTLLRAGMGPDIARAHLADPVTLVNRAIALNNLSSAQQILRIVRRDLLQADTASLQSQINQALSKPGDQASKTQAPSISDVSSYDPWPWLSDQADEIRQGIFQSPIELYANPWEARIIAKALKELNVDMAFHYLAACYELQEWLPKGKAEEWSPEYWEDSVFLAHLFIGLGKHQWAKNAIRDRIKESVRSFNAQTRVDGLFLWTFEFLDEFPLDVALSVIQDLISVEATASRLNLTILLETLAPHIVRLLSIDQIYELLLAIQSGLEWWSNEAEAA